MNLRPLLASSILLLTLLGCSKLSMENYSRITLGMPYDKVVQLIGKPGKCDDVMGLRSCTWGDDSRSVQVSFAGNEVLLFSSRNLK